MKVLVACEYSGTVREAFSKIGHEAWSCDLLPSDIPGNHLQCDALSVLDGGWDLMIAHPPCTFLSVAGAQHITKESRRVSARKAAEFFNTLLVANIPRIAIENPVQHGFARSLIRKYDQILRMNDFGENAFKPTCLWLKNLPPLRPTGPRVPVDVKKYPNGKSMSAWYASNNSSAKKRSKTFAGFAEAMADQWGKPEPREPGA